MIRVIGNTYWYSMHSGLRSAYVYRWKDKAPYPDKVTLPSWTLSSALSQLLVMVTPLLPSESVTGGMAHFVVKLPVTLQSFE